MMLFLKFNHTRTIFVLLFLIVQFDLHNSQIRFPDESDNSNENSNNYRNSSKPVNSRITNNNNRNFNTNWNYRTNCMSYRYVPGYCVPLYLCGELRYSRDFNILRRSLCGFYGNEPKVCCPAQSGNSGGGNYPNPNTGYPNNGNPNNNGNTGYPNPNGGNNGYPPNNNPNPSTPPAGINQPNDNINSNNANLDLTYPRSLPQPCGISSKEANRVVGGSPAIPGAWPWMTSLQYGKKGSRSHLCGATLISSNLVVTASHCVTNDDNLITSANLLSVRLGEHNIEEDSPDDAAQEFDVAQVIKHPDYKNDNTYISDIAVLRLNGNVQFSDRITPVCLPYDSDLIRARSLTGKSAMVTGWGLTSFNGASSPTLLQATLKIVNPQFCRNAFEKWAKISDDQICAASQGWDKDSCQGDSGGPLTMFEPNRKRWYLIGVVSFGRRCASKDLPGVYTRTGSVKHLTWLKQFY